MKIDTLGVQAFIAIAGARGPVIFVLCVIAVSVWLIARDLRRSGRLEPRVFFWMAGEAIALSLEKYDSPEPMNLGSGTEITIRDRQAGASSSSSLIQSIYGVGPTQTE